MFGLPSGMYGSIDRDRSRIANERTNKREKQFFPSGAVKLSASPIEGVLANFFRSGRSFDPLFGAVVTPFDRNHSIRYGRLSPGAAFTPFHILLSSVNLPTCLKAPLLSLSLSLFLLLVYRVHEKERESTEAGKVFRRVKLKGTKINVEIILAARSPEAFE